MLGIFAAFRDFLGKARFQDRGLPRVTTKMGMRRWAQSGLWAAAAVGLTAVLVAASAMAQSVGVATHTTMATDSQQLGGRQVATYVATVLGEDGKPAKGIVTLVENGKGLASAALDATGKAQILYDGFRPGNHSISVVYKGNDTYSTSRSEAVLVRPVANTTATPDFSLSVAPAALPASGATIVPGDSGAVVATVTSLNDFTGFVTLSCAGPPVSPGSSTDTAMPVGVTCTFTPENLQITSAVASSATPSLNSDFTVQTTAPAGANGKNLPPGAMPGNNVASPLVLAVLFPSVLGLGLLGRKRKIFSRLALVLLVGMISVMATTSCAARYRYLNHPPTANVGTPPGDYTLTIWAQTSDGVTATEHFTTMGLTVSK
jgi:hypothetical protein